jgi:hypothetical protein
MVLGWGEGGLNYLVMVGFGDFVVVGNATTHAIRNGVLVAQIISVVRHIRTKF